MASKKPDLPGFASINKLSQAGYIEPDTISKTDDIARAVLSLSLGIGTHVVLETDTDIGVLMITDRKTGRLDQRRCFSMDDVFDRIEELKSEQRRHA